MVATGAAPVEALPPGDYVVRGIIKLEDGATGRVRRTLRRVERQPARRCLLPRAW